MAIMSNQLILSDAQAVTSSQLSANVIDFKLAGIPAGAVGRVEKDMGKGEPINILIQCVEDAAAAGAATVTFTLETSDNEDMSSSEVVYSSGPVPVADLIAGYKVPVASIPFRTDKQYFAVRYTVATGPLTAGRFTAAIVDGLDLSWNR